jgi:hypothetical protein
MRPSKLTVWLLSTTNPVTSVTLYAPTMALESGLPVSALCDEMAEARQQQQQQNNTTNNNNNTRTILLRHLRADCTVSLRRDASTSDARLTDFECLNYFIVCSMYFYPRPNWDHHICRSVFEKYFTP